MTEQGRSRTRARAVARKVRESNRHFETIVLEGSASGAATAISLTAGAGGALAIGDLGLPIETRKRLVRLAVAWLDGGAPAGDWTIEVFKRGAGGTSWASVATFTVETS